MPLFSAKARRYVELAVSNLDDERQKMTWQIWAAAHPPALAGQEGGEEIIPPEVVSVALTALDSLAIEMKRQRHSVLHSDEEGPDLDNGLSYITSIKRRLAASGAESR